MRRDAQRFDLDRWVAAATAQYPEIDSLHLVGSRAAAADVAPESDWDIVVSLQASCYDDDGEPIADSERSIAFDPGLDSDSVDIWFLRPGGRVARPQASGETWIDTPRHGFPASAGWREGSEYARCLYGPSLVIDTETMVIPALPEAGTDETTLILARWLVRD